MFSLYREFSYHHFIERSDTIFTPLSGLAERRSKSGHCTNLTTFSAMEPKTNGRQPEILWAEMTTMRYARAQ
jgi:hypothetical protein